MTEKILAGGIIGVVFVFFLVVLTALESYIVMFVGNFFAEQFHLDFRLDFYQALAIVLVLTVLNLFLRGSSSSK